VQSGRTHGEGVCIGPDMVLASYADTYLVKISGTAPGVKEIELTGNWVPSSD